MLNVKMRGIVVEETILTGKKHVLVCIWFIVLDSNIDPMIHQTIINHVFAGHISNCSVNFGLTWNDM